MGHEQHEWERTGIDGVMGPFGPYTLWTKHQCTRCKTQRTVIAGVPCYDPPGKLVKGYGQLAPPCPPKKPGWYDRLVDAIVSLMIRAAPPAVTRK